MLIGFAQQKGNIVDVGVIARRAKPDVAIRFPFHVPITYPVLKEYGLPRRSAPRNDIRFIG